VGFLEDFAVPNPRWCASVVEAHRHSFAGVGGAIENRIDQPLNWAVYFCDYARYQYPVQDRESAFASDSNASYKRSALEAIRPTWESAFNEASVHFALHARGETLALWSGMVVYQNRNGLRLGTALKERFIWGRSYAAVRTKLLGVARRIFYAGLSPALPPLLVWRMAVLSKKRRLHTFLKALPWTTALTVSWSLGEFVGYLTGRPSGARPVREEAIAGARAYQLPIGSKT
jgi:hypothetical protein